MIGRTSGASRFDIDKFSEVLGYTCDRTAALCPSFSISNILSYTFAIKTMQRQCTVTADLPRLVLPRR